MDFLTAFLVFISLALVGSAVAGWLSLRAETRQALERRLNTMTGSRAQTGPESVLKDERLSSIAFLNALLGKAPLVNPIVRMVRQAGLKRRVGEVLLYIPLLALSAFLLCILLGFPPIVGVVMAWIAGTIPLLIIQRMRNARTQRFGEQLPEALDLIRSALQAGHGVPGALAVVAETFSDPIAYEFRYMVEEMKLGLPMREALHHLADRVDDSSVPILAVGILVAQDSGGNLAEVVENIGHTIRERFKLLREVRVMTAQGRLSGLVLTALPFLVALAMYFSNPGYFAPLLQQRTGHWMIAYGIASLLVGHFIIRRLVHIKV